MGRDTQSVEKKGANLVLLFHSLVNHLPSHPSILLLELLPQRKKHIKSRCSQSCVSACISCTCSVLWRLNLLLCLEAPGSMSLWSCSTVTFREKVASGTSKKSLSNTNLVDFPALCKIRHEKTEVREETYCLAVSS